MPLHQAIHYVAAAYGVVFVVVALYIGIMARKLTRLERHMTELTREER